MKSFVNGAKLEGKWVHGNRNGNAKLTFKPSPNAEVDIIHDHLRDHSLFLFLSLF